MRRTNENDKHVQHYARCVRSARVADFHLAKHRHIFVHLEGVLS